MNHIDFNKKNALYIGILISVVALAIRLLYVESSEFIDPIRADARKYFLLALNLVNHGTYSIDVSAPYSPAIAITPGYPLFLAPFVGLASSTDWAFRAILIVQSFLGALSVLLLYRLSLRALPLTWAAMLGFVIALLPHSVAFGGYVLTETWFAFLFTTAVYALIKHLESRSAFWLMLAGLGCGLAALTRPAALLLLPFIALLLTFLRIMPWRKAVILISITASPWIPWQLWVLQNIEDSQEKHSQFAAVFAFGSYPDFIFKTESMRGYPYREDPEYHMMSANTGEALAIVLKRAKANPGRYLYWYVIGKPVSYWSWNMMESVGGPFIYPMGSNIWTHTSTGQIALGIYHALHRFLLLAGTPVCFLLVYVIVRRLPNQSLANPVLLIAALIIIYFTTIHMILAAWPRYAVPFWPFFYLLGTWGLYRMATLIRQRKMVSETRDGMV